MMKLHVALMFAFMAAAAAQDAPKATVPSPPKWKKVLPQTPPGVTMAT